MQGGQLQLRERASCVPAHANAMRLCDDPPITRLVGLLSPAMCADLIAVAQQRLSPSLVQHPNGRAIVDRGQRRSDSANFTPELAGAEHISTIASRLTMEPDALLEPHVVRYASGGFFKPHHDYSVARKTPVARRASSFVCFLNDDFEGGALDFPTAQVCASPACGDLIVFDNVDADGHRIEASLHAGRPITSGEKWVLVFWTSARFTDLMKE